MYIHWILYEIQKTIIILKNNAKNIFNKNIIRCVALDRKTYSESLK